MLTLPVYRALVCAAGALLPGGSTPPSRTVARLAGEIRRTGSSPNDPPAASVICANIRCRATEHILARERPINGSHGGEPKGPELSTGNWRNVDTDRVASPRLPVIRRPVTWPNSSSPHQRGLCIMTGCDRWHRVRHSATALRVGALVLVLFLSAPASFVPRPVADAQAQQPAGKVYRIGFLRQGQPPCVKGIRRRWRPHVVRCGPSRSVPARGHLRGQDSEGREARCPPCRATHKVRVGDQQQNGQGHRPDDPLVAPVASRSDSRMTVCVDTASNMAVEQTAGSHSLAAAAHRARSAHHNQPGTAVTSSRGGS
jgi:hypothetical protein